MAGSSVFRQWDRVIAHFDLDCFYAQAEEQRRPWLKGRPLGVTQKFLVVTANYAARARGVPKMASISDARARCPDIVLVNGEDLTPYRAASKKIFAVLERFGPLERLGLDEAYVDLSPRVAAMVATGSFKEGFVGHVERGGFGGASEGSSASIGPGECHLAAGSWLASEARRAVEQETGFQMSCGISHNKLLAKLVSSRHKPNDQTTLVASAAVDFVSDLSVRKVPGVGRRLEEQLATRGVTVMKDLSSLSLQSLQSWVGPKLAPFLFDACRAYDPTLVTPKGPPKSISVEDSFPPIHSLAQAQPIVQDLLPDLIKRMDEEWEESRRRPKTFTVKWRKREKEYRFTSASCPMPSEVLSPSTPLPLRVSSLLHLASSLLLRAFPPPSSHSPPSFHPPPSSHSPPPSHSPAAASASAASASAASAAAASASAASAAAASLAIEAALPVMVINVAATNFVSCPQLPAPVTATRVPAGTTSGSLKKWLRPLQQLEPGQVVERASETCQEPSELSQGTCQGGAAARIVGSTAELSQEPSELRQGTWQGGAAARIVRSTSELSQEPSELSQGMWQVGAREKVVEQRRAEGEERQSSEGRRFEASTVLEGVGAVSVQAVGTVGTQKQTLNPLERWLKPQQIGMRRVVVEQSQREEEKKQIEREEEGIEGSLNSLERWLKPQQIGMGRVVVEQSPREEKGAGGQVGGQIAGDAIEGSLNPLERWLKPHQMEHSFGGKVHSGCSGELLQNGGDFSIVGQKRRAADDGEERLSVVLREHGGVSSAAERGEVGERGLCECEECGEEIHSDDLQEHMDFHFAAFDAPPQTMRQCEECGEETHPDCMQEHLDFHFAARLQAKEESAGNISTPAGYPLKRQRMSPSDKDVPSVLHRQPKLATAGKRRPKPAAKTVSSFFNGKCSANGTLDLFVSREKVLKR